MAFVDLFVGKAKQRVWKRLQNNHVIRSGKPLTDVDTSEIKKGEAYVTLRMRQMYLRNIRVLWRSYYPMLHGYVSYGGREDNVVAGPSQLTQLGDANLDRVVVFNQRLGGPFAYTGGDVTMLTGLYSVPGADAAKALLDTLGTIAALPGLNLATAVQISGVVKNGVENILKLDNSKLELGVKDTFYVNNPLRPGYYAAMNASEDKVVFDQLWLLETGLKQGLTPAATSDYNAIDYMIIEIERVESRDDWPSLAGFAEIQAKFNTVVADGTATADLKRERLKALWPEFQTLLNNSTELIESDKKKIAGSVAAHLNKQLEPDANPFETRSWGGGGKRIVRRTGFDFLDVADKSDDGAALRNIPF